MFVTVDPDGPMKQKVIYAMTDRSIPTYLDSRPTKTSQRTTTKTTGRQKIARNIKSLSVK